MARLIVLDEFGGPEVLHLIDAEPREPSAGEVRVRIEAFAVNRLDLMMRAGKSPAPVALPQARLGVEGTGVIDAVGEGVTGLAPGTAVIITAIPDAPVNGCYADYLTLPASRVVPRPEGLDVFEAAAVWVAFSTAYGALVERAGMKAGDRMLVNAATGSVGRAAIHVANQVGAVPIALTRHSSNKEELLAAGAAAVIATDHDDPVSSVRMVTDGAGADVVLDLVTGPAQAELAVAARPAATLIAAGFLDLRPGPALADGVVFDRYRSFEHTLDPAVVQRMAAFLQAGVRRGALHPVVGEVFTMDGVAEAHRRVEDGTQTGKVVVAT
jgi:NADPH:quinone reductase-like Zn-dependent oxidoreductase